MHRSRSHKFRHHPHLHNSFVHDMEDIVRLWILRLLVYAGGHRNFLETDGFSNDSLAESLGLGERHTTEDQKFDRNRIYADLRNLHTKYEHRLKTASIPAVLYDNAQRLSELIALDITSRRILEFVILLHNTNLLQVAAEMLGTLSNLRLYSALAVVLDIPEQRVKNSLSSSSLLARSGLIKVDHDPSRYFIDKLDLLTRSLPGLMMSNVEDPLELLREMIAPCDLPSLSLADYQHIQRDLDLVVPYLRQGLAQQRTGINIYIHGSPGTGKSQFARVLAHTFGCNLFEVAREDYDGDAITGQSRLRALRAAQAVLGARQSLLLFDEVEDIFGDGDIFWGKRSTAETNKGWLNRMLEENPVPTLWLSNSTRGLDPAFVRRFDMVFELPIPPRRQRERILHEFCSDLLPADAISRIANAEKLTPGVVERAANVVNSIRDTLPTEQLAEAVEHIISNTLTTQGHPSLKKHDPARLPTWYDPELINADTVLTDIVEGLTRSKSGRLCLYGPPGTGKTAFGRWLADQLEFPLLVKRASDLISMWLGGTEENIAMAFREAETEGGLLLIDEVDSFLQDRRGSQHSWEVSQVNEMLTQMESFSGIFIASTNLMHGLDQASLRRFDLKLKFDYLLPEQAWKMFVQQCKALGLPPPDEVLQYKVMKLAVLTPGDFAAVGRQHRFRAFTTPHMLLDALERECAVKEDGQRRSIGFI